MNVKKKIRRWALQESQSLKSLPGVNKGVVEDEGIAHILGDIVVSWSHLEDAMTVVFHNLLGAKEHDPSTARLIFTSLVSQKIRIDVMRSLLEKSAKNQSRGEEYDEIIDEFSRLNKQRNEYIHGRWWTYENGDTYIQLDNSSHLGCAELTKVSIDDMQSFLSRLTLLLVKILQLKHPIES
jgi:hypothetical protein